MCRMVLFVTAEEKERLDYYPAVLDNCSSVEFYGCLAKGALETVVTVVLAADA